MIVLSLRLRPARFSFGQALDEELEVDVVLGFAVLLGSVVGGGVEGATLESIVGEESGGVVEGTTLESTVEPASLSECGAVVCSVGVVDGATLESTVEPASFSERGAVVCSVGADLSA
jgi:hypothetical protein